MHACWDTHASGDTRAGAKTYAVAVAALVALVALVAFAVRAAPWYVCDCACVQATQTGDVTGRSRCRGIK